MGEYGFRSKNGIFGNWEIEIEGDKEFVKGIMDELRGKDVPPFLK